MKKILSFLIFSSLLITFFWNVLADDEMTAKFTWWVNSYENVTKLEFILDLKWSSLEQWISYDRQRKIEKEFFYDNWEKYKVLNIKNISKYEEKLALRLTWNNGDYIDFVNFDYPWAKKFNDIMLIEHNWKIKAKVVIYVSKDLDVNVYNTLSSWLKSGKYLYYWIKSWKPYKKARAVRVN